MFEISWSELLVLGIVTLIFVGPKELPALMRTLGRYAGAVKRQANEFKAHFDDALREMELEEMRKEMEAMRDSVNSEVMKASRAIEDNATDRTPERAQDDASGDAAAADSSGGSAGERPPMPAPPGKGA